MLSGGTKVLVETSLAGLGPTPALSSLLEVDLTLLSSSPPEASGESSRAIVMLPADPSVASASISAPLGSNPGALDEAAEDLAGGELFIPL